MFGLAAADRGDAFPQDPEWAQAETNRKRRRANERQRQSQKCRRERSFEAQLLGLDHVGVGGDLHEVSSVVAGVDLALDHPQLMSARTDRVAAKHGAVIVPDWDQLRQLGREQRLRGANFRRVHVGAGNLPVPAGEGEFELRRDRRRSRRLPLFSRDGDIGDQRLEIDAKLVVEIGLAPLLVERAQTKPCEREDEDAPERRREKKARSDRTRAKRLEHEGAYGTSRTAPRAALVAKAA